MRIDTVRLRGFRNYDEKDITFGDVTLLVGPNASGKTNLIEAVQLTTSARSFRNPAWEDVVGWGWTEAQVGIEAQGDGSRVEIVLSVTKEGTRGYSVNGTQRRRVSDIVGLVPSVVFTPDDLRLVKGSGERRRVALDEVGEQLWATYGKVKRDYSRALRQRNLLLREGRGGGAEIGSWTEQVLFAGARLMALRTRLLSRMAKVVSTAYADIASGEELEVRYADRQGLDPSAWVGGVDIETAREAMLATLAARKGEEAARRTTIFGPHRDDVAFSIKGRSARTFASQGQQRSIALAWKIAALRTLREVTGRGPVLLLDDVMSELDRERRRSLMGLFGDETQTLVTTTNLEYFDAATLERATIVELP